MADDETGGLALDRRCRCSRVTEFHLEGYWVREPRHVIAPGRQDELGAPGSPGWRGRQSASGSAYPTCRRRRSWRRGYPTSKPTQIDPNPLTVIASMVAYTVRQLPPDSQPVIGVGAKPLADASCPPGRPGRRRSRRQPAACSPPVFAREVKPLTDDVPRSRCHRCPAGHNPAMAASFR